MRRNSNLSVVAIALAVIGGMEIRNNNNYSKRPVSDFELPEDKTPPNEHDLIAIEKAKEKRRRRALRK